jgi:(R)-2-hydroxyacyl-CoA dehydratese activating ATPase
MAQYFAGIDIGSTMTKAAITEGNSIAATVISVTGPEHRKLANRVMEEALEKAGLKLDDIAFIIATGYGRINVPFADKQVTEISCHARGVHFQIPTARTVIDVGGQDCKGIKLNGKGKIIDFVMNDKCAAGAGRFIELMAETLGIKLEDMGRLSLAAKGEAFISSTCTVFAEQEVMARLSEGVPIEDLIAGIHKSIATRIAGLVNRIKIEPDVVLTGGGAKNAGLAKALENKMGMSVKIPPEPLLTGAIGAAILAREAAEGAIAKGLSLPPERQPLQEARFFE